MNKVGTLNELICNKGYIQKNDDRVEYFGGNMTVQINFKEY